MKTTVKYLIAMSILACLANGQLQAQTVYAGEQTIDKQPMKGLILTVPLDGRQVEKDWEEQLKSYGRVSSSRSTYKVSTADIPAVSAEPLNLVSQLKTSRTSATVFVAFDLGGGNFIAPGNGNYDAAERLLKEFAAKAQYNQEVRLAEDNFNESQKNHQKLVRTGERLQRDQERNKKEKENLLRRIDENAKELDQLTKDLETNKSDQANALTDLDTKKKGVETVKTKKP